MKEKEVIDLKAVLTGREPGPVEAPGGRVRCEEGQVLFEDLTRETKDATQQALAPGEDLPLIVEEILLGRDTREGIIVLKALVEEGKGARMISLLDLQRGDPNEQVVDGVSIPLKQVPYYGSVQELLQLLEERKMNLANSRGDTMLYSRAPKNSAELGQLLRSMPKKGRIDPNFFTHVAASIPAVSRGLAEYKPDFGDLAISEQPRLHMVRQYKFVDGQLLTYEEREELQTRIPVCNYYESAEAYLAAKAAELSRLEENQKGYKEMNKQRVLEGKPERAEDQWTKDEIERLKSDMREIQRVQDER